MTTPVLDVASLFLGMHLQVVSKVPGMSLRVAYHEASLRR